MDNKQYIKMMEDSLIKKIDLLNQLQGLNREQKDILEDYDSAPEDFDENMDKKSSIIDILDKMDEGFQDLYDKVKDELEVNKDSYSTEIKNMQQSIRTITDLSASIQAEEARNKEIAKKRFSYVRSQIKDTRANQKAVASYYSSMMNNTGYEGSQFWDKKK